MRNTVVPPEEFHYAGELLSKDGLQTIAPLLASCSWAIDLVQSGYDGTFYLRASHHEIDLEMQSGQRNRFLFSGSATDTEEIVKGRLGELSALLSRGKIAHRIELYSETGQGEERVGFFHYGWHQE